MEEASAFEAKSINEMFEQDAFLGRYSKLTVGPSVCLSMLKKVTTLDDNAS